MTRDIFKRGNLGVGSPLDEPKPKPEPKVPSNDAPVVAAPAAVARAKTAPGGMVNFLVQRSEAHKEVEQLKQRLKDFDGAVAARPLDPAQIRDSEWANRHESSFKTPEFAEFKEEIRNAGGNLLPIKVRRLVAMEEGVSPGNTLYAYSYEVVYGHRRRRACLELGLPVLAFVEDDLDNQSLFVEMFRENIGRADLTPWEQGVMHSNALSTGLFSSVRQLAKALGQEPGTISKVLSIAQLPKPVVKAFSSPLVLQYRWVGPLNEALQKDPDGLLARATEIGSEQEQRRGKGEPAVGEAEVMAQLLGLPVSRSSPTASWIEMDGKKVARLKVDAAGRPTVDFKFAMTSAKREALATVIKSFLME